MGRSIVIMMFMCNFLSMFVYTCTTN